MAVDLDAISGGGARHGGGIATRGLPGRAGDPGGQRPGNRRERRGPVYSKAGAMESSGGAGGRKAGGYRRRLITSPSGARGGFPKMPYLATARPAVGGSVVRRVAGR